MRTTKAEWGDGPWQNEPDELRWKDEATGFECCVTRGPVGSWNGYVGIQNHHHLTGQGYDRAYEISEISVHGGLTYAARSPKFIPDNQDLWWFGFDCSHSGDISPAMNRTARFDGETYKDFEYVKAETLSLAKQLAASEPLKACEKCGQEIKRP